MKQFMEKKGPFRSSPKPKTQSPTPHLPKCADGFKLDSLKPTFSPLKIGYPKRKLVFQPSIFRCYVSFREGKHASHSFYVLF